MRLITVLVINPREQTIKQKTVANCFAGLRSFHRKLYGVTDLTQSTLNVVDDGKLCALSVSGLPLANLVQEISEIEVPQFKFHGKMFNGITVIYSERTSLPGVGNLQSCPLSVAQAEELAEW